VSPSGSKLVAEWYDSAVTSDRLRSLQLWRGSNGQLMLWRATRSTPYDVWSPPHCCGAGVTLGDAQQLAERHGLERYVPGSLSLDMQRLAAAAQGLGDVPIGSHDDGRDDARADQ
jgi:hypothetical protein